MKKMKSTINTFLVVFLYGIINACSLPSGYEVSSPDEFVQVSFINENGTLKHFGIGYKNKTIFPLWLISILYAIISYFIVLLYISFNNFVY